MIRAARDGSFILSGDPSDVVCSAYICIVGAALYGPVRRVGSGDPANVVFSSHAPLYGQVPNRPSVDSEKPLVVLRPVIDVQAAYRMAVSVERSLKWILGRADRRPRILCAAQIYVFCHFKMTAGIILSGIDKVAQLFQVFPAADLIGVFRRPGAVKLCIHPPFPFNIILPLTPFFHIRMIRSFRNFDTETVFRKTGKNTRFYFRRLFCFHYYQFQFTIWHKVPKCTNPDVGHTRRNRHAFKSTAIECTPFDNSHAI